MLSGRAKCEWLVGKKNAEAEGLNGNCERCKHFKFLGVHGFCDRSDFPGRSTAWDSAVMSIKSDLDKEVRCLNCNVHLNPKTVRCSECLQTKELTNFKKWVPGRMIDI